MKIHQTNNYQERSHQSKPMRRPSLARQSNSNLTDITLQDILRHLGAGLIKLWVALKYQFHRLTGGAFLNIRLPWYKLALAALAFFILAKKDVQFSINMKAPLSGFASNEEGPEQMSLVQPVALKRPASTALDAAQVQSYIERFGKVACIEMQKFGIPASIIMAQAILESKAGKSPEAERNNNHFGAPMSGSSYENAWENWRAHSLLLREQYPELFRTSNNSNSWAQALQQAGYSKDKDYARQLLGLIEKYQLYKLDEI